MYKYFKLVRLQTLLVIAVMQLMTRRFVVLTILYADNIYPTNSSLNLLLLVLATTLIAAGAFIIRDYFNIKTDRINTPAILLIGESISKKQAMYLYQVSTFIGVAGGLLLSWHVRSMSLALIFILVPGLLWFYAASYKRQCLVGNIILALSAALSILIVLLAEFAYLQTIANWHIDGQLYRQAFAWVGVITVFTFFIVFILAIVHDISNIQGDKEMEYRTMPIVWGVNTAKFIAIALVIFNMVSMLYLDFKYNPFTGNLITQYLVVGVVSPFAWFIYLMVKAKCRSDYKRILKVIRLIMLIVLLFAPFFYLLHSLSLRI